MRKFIVPAGAIVAAVLMVSTSVFASMGPGLSMAAGEHDHVTCAGPRLSTSNKTATGVDLSCAANPTTTTVAPPTTTTAPPATTTTVPAATTTLPADTTTTVPALPAGCSFQRTANPAALCETFDQPDPIAGTRSGALNGVLWGVSHATSSNVYDWAASTQTSPCGTGTVAPENDVTVCDGQMIESANDNGGQTVLAAYPRQPFDFAGRTGTVEFDVSDNSQGPHAAWPTFAITDQPVPAPYGGNALGIADTARNSIGVSFADSSSTDPFCTGYPNPTGIGVDDIYDTANYVPDHLSFNHDGCVKASTTVGVNNHVEIQVSSARIKVFMADAGAPSTLKLVADASFAVPLTRGLVWLEDIHYNADKFNSQQTNTFSWDNVAFDGPVLPRDLGFDIADNTASAGRAENGLPLTGLGYTVPGSGSLTLTVPNVTGTAGAAGALLELTYWPEAAQTLTYSVNGDVPLQFAWPFPGGPTFVSQTVAMPVPLADVHDGANTVTLSTSDHADGVAVANFDLILAGAGGIVEP